MSSPCTVGDRVGQSWIVTSGLKPGEQVITDGMKVREGVTVNPQPDQTLQHQPAAEGL